MNEKGQVYFASDKEIPQEDKSRYEEALEEYRAGIQRHVDDLERREREYDSDALIDYLNERTKARKALREEACAEDRTREQKKE